MRKVAKLLAVLLPLTIVFAGCQTARVGPAVGDIEEAPWGTDGWVTVFSAITDMDGTFHFHAGGDGPAFLEIQRIFVNNSAVEEGATVLFDFTASPTNLGPGTEHFMWVNPDLMGNIADGETEDGRFVLVSNGNDYRYGGGFGSLLLAGYAYMGFVIRTDNGGNARFAFGGYPNHVVVSFRELME